MEQSLGKRIVSNRKRMGLTQDQLAEHMGVTAQAVSKWENDQSCPDITMLPKLAELFGISVDTLLGREEPAREAEIVRDIPEQKNAEADPGKSTWEFKWDSGRKSGVLFAVMVLWVGVLTLLGKIFAWADIGFWDILWPSALIFWGVSELLKKFSVFGTVLTVSGLFFLIDNMDFLNIGLGWEYLLPILLVICGIGLLIDALRKPKKGGFRVVHNGKNVHGKTHFTTAEEHFDSAVSFNEQKQLVCLDRLSSGNISVSFGEAVIDLSGCREIAPDCAIDAACSFGELCLMIPRKYRAVYDESSKSFAELSVSGHPDPDAEQKIRINANVSFGEMTIQYI